MSSDLSRDPSPLTCAVVSYARRLFADFSPTFRINEISIVRNNRTTQTLKYGNRTNNTYIRACNEIKRLVCLFPSRICLNVIVCLFSHDSMWYSVDVFLQKYKTLLNKVYLYILYILFLVFYMGILSYDLIF